MTTTSDTTLNPSLLTVYFDGLCPLCSREIDYYRTKAGADNVSWVDITSVGFDARAEGLDPDRVHAVFHVKTTTGTIVAGVEAFIEIWKVIPALNTWARLSELPGVKPAMRLGYTVFARIRPYLPRRKRDDCDTGLCDPSTRASRTNQATPRTSERKPS